MAVRTKWDPHTEALWFSACHVVSAKKSVRDDYSAEVFSLDVVPDDLLRAHLNFILQLYSAI